MANPISTYPNPPKKWLMSWQGKEHIKNELIEAAHEVVRTDTLVRSNSAYQGATGLIMDAMMHNTNYPSAIQDAATAQNKLYELHKNAVWAHHLEYDFVMKVWYPILDPSRA